MSVQQYSNGRRVFSSDGKSNKMKPKVLTCVYCGMAYPEGTPPHGAQILTDHIKVCEKHPMRKAEDTILKLRRALSRLVGASFASVEAFTGAQARGDLKAMEIAARSINVPGTDRAAIIKAIHVLIETER